MNKLISKELTRQILSELRTGSFRKLPAILRESPESLPKEVFEDLAIFLEGRDRLVFLEDIAKACGYRPSTIKSHRARGTDSGLKIPPLFKFGRRLACLQSTLNAYLTNTYQK